MNSYMLMNWLLSALFLYITASMVKGFYMKSFATALLASLLLGLLNIVLKPLLLLLTLPINILTLGLFTFVVNAMILRLTAAMLKNFSIAGWTPAILAALVLTLINLIFYIAF